MSEEKTTEIVRTASDVLLAIESKMDTILKIANQSDSNIKTALNRINRVYLYIDGLEKEMAAELQKNQVAPNQTPIITIPSTTIQDNRINSPEIVVHESSEPSTGRRGAVNQPVQQESEIKDNSNAKKIPVVQRITDSTGKDLYLADTFIFDSNGQQVAKTKTNAVGKWQAYLPPGQYKVKIEKVDAASKKKIESEQTITVPNSNSTFTLPVAIIRR
jgi:predicted membrane-bound mannosyltransferase